jgi:glycine cleavage system regulatory protein
MMRGVKKHNARMTTSAVHGAFRKNLATRQEFLDNISQMQKGDPMDEKKGFVLVTVSGPDRPGITAAFSRILVENQVEIVDIEQASLQDFLGLSIR